MLYADVVDYGYLHTLKQNVHRAKSIEFMQKEINVHHLFLCMLKRCTFYAKQTHFKSMDISVLWHIFKCNPGFMFFNSKISMESQQYSI